MYDIVFLLISPSQRGISHYIEGDILRISGLSSMLKADYARFSIKHDRHKGPRMITSA